MFDRSEIPTFGRSFLFSPLTAGLFPLCRACLYVIQILELREVVIISSSNGYPLTLLGRQDFLSQHNIYGSYRPGLLRRSGRSPGKPDGFGGGDHLVWPGSKNPTYRGVSGDVIF